MPGFSGKNDTETEAEIRSFIKDNYGESYWFHCDDTTYPKCEKTIKIQMELPKKDIIGSGEDLEYAFKDFKKKCLKNSIKSFFTK